ncbi:hypothetical protein EXIGLDRAFT_771823 [Exidia glandulosa HHB12029]|uniref:Uncharacterized protein n=1 Tax=Exidia glandulosa HHB12029 TaxID=1314781 RepID=A0A165FQT6_EXIGL|nr:hypothetical protein EXIGLDRAFT_771823 [Exidia glandulosa HHB12029]
MPVISSGPNEPTAPQMSNLSVPLVRELALLQDGVEMESYDDDAIVEVYADPFCDICDSPARAKFNATAAHSHKKTPCVWCESTLDQFNEYLGYENGYAKTTDAGLLRRAYEWLHARSKTAAEKLFKKFGVRWTIFNTLPGWGPRSKQVLDFMHAFYLGNVSHFWSNIVVHGYLISNVGGASSPMRRFERFMNKIRWPGHIGRLPKNLGENQSLQKADQWRRLLTVLPVGLFVAWADENDEIPLGAPPVPPNAKRTVSFTRDLSQTYSSLLSLAVAGRILPSHAISVAQGRTGGDYYRSYCTSLLDLGIKLRPNNHWTTHVPEEVIARFGPIPGTWLFPFERYNGYLERVTLNGHDGGVMELTLMRHWVRSHLLYEYLLNLPDDAEDCERDSLTEIIKEDARRRGSLLTQLAVAQSEEDGGVIALPKKSQPFHVHKRATADQYPQLYRLLLEFSRQQWPTVNVISESSLDDGSLLLADSSVTSYPYIRRLGIRYTSSTNSRTDTDRFAMLRLDDILVPAEIVYILRLEVADAPPLVCLAVRRLATDLEMPIFPWDIVSDELGIYSCYAERYQELEIVLPNTLDSPIAICSITSRKIPDEIWVCVSLDRSGYELEDADDGAD